METKVCLSQYINMEAVMSKLSIIFLISFAFLLAFLPSAIFAQDFDAEDTSSFVNIPWELPSEEKLRESIILDRGFGPDGDFPIGDGTPIEIPPEIMGPSGPILPDLPMPKILEEPEDPNDFPFGNEDPASASLSAEI